MKAVVETNITIAANGLNTHACKACQLDCIDFLQKLVTQKSRNRIFLDSFGLIFDEYKNHLNYKGQPGVGDVFFKYLHDHMYLNKNVKLVPITPVVDEARGFSELPINTVDKSDRKFLAVAHVAKATVFNALDTDWQEQAMFIEMLGVSVKQICPEHGCPN